jgi:hypothetical protein
MSLEEVGIPQMTPEAEAIRLGDDVHDVTARALVVALVDVSTDPSGEEDLAVVGAAEAARRDGAAAVELSGSPEDLCRLLGDEAFRAAMPRPWGCHVSDEAVLDAAREARADLLTLVDSTLMPEGTGGSWEPLLVTAAQSPGERSACLVPLGRTEAATIRTSDGDPSVAATLAVLGGARVLRTDAVRSVRRASDLVATLLSERWDRRP